MPFGTAKERAARFVEWIERLRELLADFGPGLEIPLTLAGRGPTILRLAARHAVRWNTFSGIGVELDEALLRGREDNAKLDALCAQTGRTVIRSAMLGYHRFVPETPWRSDQAFAEVVERWRAVGFDEIVFYYPPDTNMPDSTVTPGVFERAFTAPEARLRRQGAEAARGALAPGAGKG